jgi:hypothetical protein
MSRLDRAKLLAGARAGSTASTAARRSARRTSAARICTSVPSLLDVARLAAALDPEAMLARRRRRGRRRAAGDAMRGVRRGAAAGRDDELRDLRATLAIPSLREAYAAVEKLAPILKANAEKPPAEVVKRRLAAHRGRPAAAARMVAGMEQEARERRGHGEPSNGRRGVERRRPGGRPRSAPRCFVCGASGALAARAPRMSATLLALGAIALWATLASLGVALAHVPPFLLTGPRARDRQRAGVAAGAAVERARVDARARHLRPVRLPLPALRRPAQRARRSRPTSSTTSGRSSSSCSRRCSCPGCGCAGARRRGARGVRRRRARRSSAGERPSGGFAWGYLPGPRLGVHLGELFAADAPVAHFPTAVVGLFGSSRARSRCSAISRSSRRWRFGARLGLIVAVGLGPLGAAFYLWDAALKRGDARRIGILSYLTPLASTLLLVARRAGR